jgi:hypothetical protein
MKRSAPRSILLLGKSLHGRVLDGRRAGVAPRYFAAGCTGQLPSNGGQFGTKASASG